MVMLSTTAAFSEELTQDVVAHYSGYVYYGDTNQFPANGLMLRITGTGVFREDFTGLEGLWIGGWLPVSTTVQMRFYRLINSSWTMVYDRTFTTSSEEWSENRFNVHLITIQN